MGCAEETSGPLSYAVHGLNNLRMIPISRLKAFRKAVDNKWSNESSLPTFTKDHDDNVKDLNDVVNGLKAKMLNRISHKINEPRKRKID